MFHVLAKFRAAFATTAIVCCFGSTKVYPLFSDTMVQASERRFGRGVRVNYAAVWAVWLWVQ